MTWLCIGRLHTLHFGWYSAGSAVEQLRHFCHVLLESTRPLAQDLLYDSGHHGSSVIPI